MIPKAWQKAARQQLRAAKRDIFFEMASHCFGDKRRCCPSQRRLAQKTHTTPSNAHQHIDDLDAWHVITRHHVGRYCEYELHDPAEWRVPPRVRRKKTQPKVSAPDCSVLRTEGIIYSVDSSLKEAPAKKTKPISRIPLPCPLSTDPTKTRDKRVNLIKTLRRWAKVSPHLAEDERPRRLAMLDRAESALDDWKSRSIENKKCFDILVDQVRAHPLDYAVIRSIRQKAPPSPDGNSIGAILAGMGGWFPGGGRAP